MASHALINAWKVKMINKVLLMSAVLLLLINSPAQAQPLSLNKVVEQGHYDFWVRDFSAFAEEAVHQALARGYYMPISQRQALMRQVQTKLSPEVLSQRLISQLQNVAANKSVRAVRAWYATEVGQEALRDIQQAYAPGAQRRQMSIAPSLMADEDRYQWWLTYSAKYPFAERWLTLRDQVLLASVSHIAETMKPYTPFDGVLLKDQLAKETFHLRPKVEERIMWRALDSLSDLDVTEYVRYKEFTTGASHVAFLKLVGGATDRVMTQAIADFKVMLSESIVPEPAPIESTEEAPEDH